MRDTSDRPPISSSTPASFSKKRLGGYLVEAGLLTPAQVDVALNDQKLTGMRFGEILAARGWVKQQTIEYLMHKVVKPEQETAKPAQGATTTQERQESAVNPRSANPTPSTGSDAHRQAARREIPIAKPLPSVGASDGDISWAG